MAVKWKNATPIVPDMWHDYDGEIRLVGSICEDCGEVYFPKKEIDICSYCLSGKIRETELSHVGQIVSWTVVHQQPAGGFYKGSVPFTYVIVELPEGVHVQGHFVDSDQVATGLSVQVVLDLLWEEEGNQVVTFKFAPAKEVE